MLSKQLDGVIATLESILDFDPDLEDDAWVNKHLIEALKDKLGYVREQLA